MIRPSPTEPKLRGQVRDFFENLRVGSFTTYQSSWTRITASGSVDFTHGLLYIPGTVDVLSASDSQGTVVASASSVTVTKTDKKITVANAGTDLFFQVRAF